MVGHVGNQTENVFKCHSGLVIFWGILHGQVLWEISLSALIFSNPLVSYFTNSTARHLAFSFVQVASVELSLPVTVSQKF